MRRAPVLLTALALATPLAAQVGQPVTLQLKWQHQFQFAGYYAAEAQGYYAQEGLRVTIVEGDAAHPPIPAVLSGRAQFGIGDSDVLRSRLQGSPLVVCAAIFQHSPYVILSRRDRGLTRPSDLVDARVMMSDDQGAPQLRAMLIGEGIDPARVQIVPHSWNLADLIEGRVDAISAYESVEPLMLERRGVEPAVLRSSDYGTDFYGDTLFTTEAEIAKHPERVAGFLRASLKGWQYAFDHPEEVADRILRLPGVQQRGVTRDFLLEEAQAMRPLVLPDLVELGHMNPARWRQIADALAAQDLAPAKAPLDGFLYAPEPRADPARLRWILGLLAACLAAVAAVGLWNLQMRRSVKARTREMRHEIRQREATEEELRASEERFRQIAENIHEVFWMTPPDKSRMLYVSPAYESIWGRTTRSLYDDPGAWMAAVHPEDRDRVMKASARQAEGGYDEIYRILRPDGALRWIRDRAYPIRDRQGVIYRIAGTAEDVTERRLVEQQLQRAQRLESLGTLAGGIAHDLNNVLAPMLMGVELIRLNTSDAKVLSLAETIERSAQRGAALVKQVLSFARGGTEGEKTAIEVGSLVGELRAIVDSTFPKSITMRSTIADDAWAVLGDATQLSQVLLNLAVNARDAMPNGGVIRLAARNALTGPAEVERGVTPGRYLVLEMTNSGGGIPPEVLERIFDPFFTTKGVGQGTGLGLPMALGIVQGHGGHVEVESEVGRGTTFRVYLPALPAAGENVEAAADHDLAGPGGTASGDARGEGQLILVVDDERSILGLTRQILEGAGYRVVTAHTGTKAAEVFDAQQGQVALVLTDLMMPVMDGATLIESLRQADARLPILGSSGNFDPSILPRLRDLGVEVLTKPFTSEVLLRAIRLALRPPTEDARRGE